MSIIFSSPIIYKDAEPMYSLAGDLIRKLSTGFASQPSRSAEIAGSFGPLNEFRTEPLVINSFRALARYFVASRLCLGALLNQS